MCNTFSLNWSPSLSTNHEIRLVVFDWAGTTVDFGCFAPVDAFVRTFAHHGIAVTPAEVRVAMGLHKKDHLLALLRQPEVSQRWNRATGRTWTERDLESLYNTFIPLQMETVAEHDPGLFVFGPDRSRVGRLRYWRAARAVRPSVTARRPSHRRC